MPSKLNCLQRNQNTKVKENVQGFKSKLTAITWYFFVAKHFCFTQKELPPTWKTHLHQPVLVVGIWKHCVGSELRNSGFRAKWQNWENRLWDSLSGQIVTELRDRECGGKNEREEQLTKGEVWNWTSIYKTACLCISLQFVYIRLLWQEEHVQTLERAMGEHACERACRGHLSMSVACDQGKTMIVGSSVYVCLILLQAHCTSDHCTLGIIFNVTRLIPYKKKLLYGNPYSAQPVWPKITSQNHYQKK